MPQRKKLLLPTIFNLIGFIILCGLGIWQIQRLEWKTGIIEALNAEYAKDASKNSISPSDLDRFEGHFFDDSRDKQTYIPPFAVRGTVTGIYNPDKQILLGTRFYDNLPGKHVITPLQLEDGSWLLVNRGWVTQHWTSTDEIDPPMPGKKVTITGLLRKPSERNPFTPGNVPQKDEWFYPDAGEIAAAKHIREPVHAYMMYEEKDDNLTDYPLAAATRPVLRNDHLQYAIFWFSMAGVLLIIYILRFLRK
jgi:surfeit locus 1 family protein